MKKGISLIVLVITIIVMIIIAGAIILSLNSSNVTGKANWATVSSDRANYQAELATVIADEMLDDENDANKDGIVDMEEFLDSDGYNTWKTKVTAISNRFTVVGEDAEGPAAIKVMYIGDVISGAPETQPDWYSPKAA